MNNIFIEIEHPNIKTNMINKIHIQNFKIYKWNFSHMVFRLEITPWFLRIRWLYISKNIKNINSNKKHLKYNNTVRIIILNSLNKYIKSPLNNFTSAYLLIKELKENIKKKKKKRKKKKKKKKKVWIKEYIKIMTFLMEEVFQAPNIKNKLISIY